MQDNEKPTAKRKKTLWTALKLFGCFILLFIIMSNIIPGWIRYRPKAHCQQAESDANNIAATIADYFANPSHTTLPIISGDSVYLGYTLSAKGGQNIAWVYGNPMDRITIVVQDTSGECPADYRTSSANSRTQDKWSSTSNLYTKIMD